MSTIDPNSDAYVPHLSINNPLRILQREFFGDRQASTALDFMWDSELGVPACWDAMQQEAAKFIQAKNALAEEERLDASVWIWTPRDMLSAWCTVFPPVNGGEDMTEELIREKLRDSQVSIGLDDSVIRVMAQEHAYLYLAKVASGLPPQHGENGVVEDIIFAQRKPGVLQDESGRVDFKELNWIINVAAGEQLCRIIPPKPGRDGFNVRGQRLSAKEGRPAPYVSGDNTEYTPDGEHLVASVEGQLIRRQGRYIVTETLTIDGNVDYSTGNIHFTGNVVVTGNVCPYFSVTAKKDIIVHGTVDSGTLSAGGDIYVRGGVLASNHGTLQAGGSIRCKFMEYGNADAAGDVYFESLIHSDVSCGGDIYVTSGRGVVIGGTLTSMGNITVNVAGNRANCATSLCLLCTGSFLDHKRALLLELETASSKCAKLTAAVEKLKSLPKAPQEELHQLESALPIERIKVQRLQNTINELEEQAEAVASGHISINRSYPHVSVRITNGVLLLNEEAGAAAYYLKDGEILTVRR